MKKQINIIIDDNKVTIKNLTFSFAHRLKIFFLFWKNNTIILNGKTAFD